MLTKEQIDKTLLLVRYARFSLSEKLPYMSRILLMLKFEPCMEVSTMTTSKQCVTKYNPEFVWSLTDQQICGVVLHEALHILCKHWDRVLTRDMYLFNFAADLAINQIIESITKSTKNAIILPDKTISIRDFTPNLPVNLLAEEYYDLLSDPKNKDKVPNQAVSQVGSGNCGSCAGSKDNLKDDEGDGESNDKPRYTQAELEAASYSAAAQIEACGKNAGNIPVGLQRWVNLKLAPPKIKWKNVLRSLVQRYISKSRGMTDYTFRNPSRRQSVFGYGPNAIILPSLCDPHIEGVVAVDTSGSMGDKELTDAINETKGILDAIRTHVHFYTCDTKIHSAAKVKNLKDIICNMKGGGGTELSPIFTKVKEDKLNPSFIIVITDGYCSVPKNQPKDIPVIYLIVGKGSKDPGFHGKVLFTNKD